MKGIFITLEGPDGSGKSTILKLIENHLKEENIDFLVTREPGGTPIGEDIREIILSGDNKNMSPKAEALLYAASRAQHVNEKIFPALMEGKLVICDRFVLSSLAYQGVGRNLGIEEVKTINDFAISGIQPDLTLFFDIDPVTTLNRKVKNEKGDRLEEEGEVFHKRVYNGYKALLEKYPKNIEVIDAAKTIDEVFSQCISLIYKLIK